MYLYRQPIMTGRPLGIDVDEEGVLWFGSTSLYRYDPLCATARVIRAKQDTSPVSQCLCVNGLVYLLRQKSSKMGVYDPNEDRLWEVDLPSPQSNIWYGHRIPGRPECVLYDRDAPGLVHWHAGEQGGVFIPYPFKGEPPANAVYVPEHHALYSAASRPARLIRFNLETMQFDHEFFSKEENVFFTGMVQVGTTLYVADGGGGRLIPFDLSQERWGEPLGVPGYGDVFAYIGAGVSFRNLALFNLSSYRNTYWFDPKANRFVAKEGEENPDLGIHGRPYHFLDRFLAFDPSDGTFDYLITPQEKDAYYLVCYALVDGERLFITGYNIFNPQRGEINGRESGPWSQLVVWQSVPKMVAEVEEMRA